MMRKAVTAPIVKLEIQCVMSNAHRFDVPNGRKKFSFLISLQDRTANSTYVGPPQMVATTANTMVCQRVCQGPQRDDVILIHPCTWPANFRE